MMKTLLLAAVLVCAPIAAQAQSFTPDPPFTTFTLQSALIQFNWLQNQLQAAQRQITNLQRFKTGNWNNIVGDMQAINVAESAFPQKTSDPRLNTILAQLQLGASQLSSLQARAQGASGMAQTLQVANEMSSLIAGQLQLMQQEQAMEEAEKQGILNTLTTPAHTNRL